MFLLIFVKMFILILLPYFKDDPTRFKLVVKLTLYYTNFVCNLKYIVTFTMFTWVFNLESNRLIIKHAISIVYGFRKNKFKYRTKHSSLVATPNKKIQFYFCLRTKFYSYLIETHRYFNSSIECVLYYIIRKIQ